VAVFEKLDVGVRDPRATLRQTREPSGHERASVRSTIEQRAHPFGHELEPYYSAPTSDSENCASRRTGADMGLRNVGIPPTLATPPLPHCAGRMVDSLVR